MKKIKFAFGIHNHQPIGNFDFVFEEAYQKSYRPFLEVLQRHPAVRISIHFTGILLDWFEKHHPDLLEMIVQMVDRGQLEIMSGGYYEPILSVIPERDQLGQIAKLNERIRNLFNYEPQGMWLAERVWEPTLPTPLRKAGMRYTVLDDTHFKYAGLQEEDLKGYFLTEDLGHTVALFPINKTLRYTIPFQDAQQTIEALQNMATEEGTNLMVFADDGEKFGVWPNTFKHVYEDGWLENFFRTLEENAHWIELVHFSEALEQLKPVGNIYLPTASYSEMMEWSLFTPAIKKFEAFQHKLQENGLWDAYAIFVRGGFWRNFMSKYSEVNVMHKKMLRLSHLINRNSITDQHKFQKALDHLWAAQVNCPYWHGVFGGLYLSHLRFAIFNHLIEAEKILDEHRSLPEVNIVDFDADGHDEILVETKIHDAYFKPDSGAIMFEFDFKPTAKNLLDTMTRREEAYHEKLKEAVFVGDEQQMNGGQTASIHDLVLTKEPDLMQYLHYDYYERRSLVDHCFPLETSLQAFADGQAEELADFYNGAYTLQKAVRQKNKTILYFKRQGTIRQKNKRLPLEIEKTVIVCHTQADVEVSYTLTNLSEEELHFLFGVEFNFGLQAGQAEDRYYYVSEGRLDPPYLNSSGVIDDAVMIGLRDEYLKTDIQVRAEDVKEIWRAPVETISLSEGGFERVYQSSAVLMVHEIHLEKRVQFTVRQFVQKIEG